MALNPLQERIALLAPDLATEHAFALVGGAALNILDFVDRRTQDLDHFHPLHTTAVARHSDALEGVLQGVRLDVHVVRRSDTPPLQRLRWAVMDRHRPRALPAAVSGGRHSLRARPGTTDLAVNKLLAAFSRHEPATLLTSRQSSNGALRPAPAAGRVDEWQRELESRTLRREGPDFGPELEN